MCSPPAEPSLPARRRRARVRWAQEFRNTVIAGARFLSGPRDRVVCGGVPARRAEGSVPEVRRSWVGIVRVDLPEGRTLFQRHFLLARFGSRMAQPLTGDGWGGDAPGRRNMTWALGETSIRSRGKGNGRARHGDSALG
jgi:hypothetical protein